MRKRNTKETWLDNTAIGDERMDDEIPIITGIKEMPAYDPDMEIKGLAFTIPTWINVIAKTEKKMNVALASGSAKEQLAVNLTRLKEQIDHMLEVLR